MAKLKVAGFDVVDNDGVCSVKLTLSGKGKLPDGMESVAGPKGTRIVEILQSAEGLLGDAWGAFDIVKDDVTIADGADQWFEWFTGFGEAAPAPEPEVEAPAKGKGKGKKAAPAPEPEPEPEGDDEGDDEGEPEPEPEPAKKGKKAAAAKVEPKAEPKKAATKPGAKPGAKPEPKAAAKPAAKGATKKAAAKPEPKKRGEAANPRGPRMGGRTSFGNSTVKVGVQEKIEKTLNGTPYTATIKMAKDGTWDVLEAKGHPLVKKGQKYGSAWRMIGALIGKPDYHSVPVAKFFGH